MRILAIADIHNDVENLMQFLDKAAEIGFDVIVFPGDFTDVPPKGFTQKEIAKIIIEQLKSFKKPVLALPGNLDDNATIELMKSEGISLHEKGVVIGGVGFYGFGGAKTPFGTAFEPSDAEIERGLGRAYEQVKGANVKIQVTHNPPVNSKLDLISSGAHVGSEAVRNFIEKNKPEASISAHIHEAKGVDYIGNTKAVNPGRLPEGYCAFIEITGKNVDAKIASLI